MPARGEVAQLVEHTTENRGVAGSIPALAIVDRMTDDRRPTTDDRFGRYAFSIAFVSMTTR
jgi:hypothetical protein